MNTESKDVERVVYSYATHLNGIEEENRFLKETVNGLRQELEKFRRKPLLVCKVKEINGEDAVIKLSNGNLFLVGVAESYKDIKPGDQVLVEQKNLTIVRKINHTSRFDVEKFVIMEKPSTNWEQIGGLSKQSELIKEIIELPLKRPDLFKKMGITPPKGILLYGHPGTGKTLLAKAVANSTSSTFIEIVASELVQKFIGEGAKLVKEIFALAREKAPSIVFIDEIDALATVRVDMGTSGEREVQRTFMQLLAEIDGFKGLDNVKIIGCTNRREILDPAILRPGRLDRLIYVPLPEKQARKDILSIHSFSMPLHESYDAEDIAHRTHDFSGADLQAVCTEAGYAAIRAGKRQVTQDHFLEAINSIREEKQEEDIDTTMFG